MNDGQQKNCCHTCLTAVKKIRLQLLMDICYLLSLRRGLA